MGLCRVAYPSPNVKQVCVLAAALFSIFFSLKLRKSKEDPPDGVHIGFRTDGSHLNLRCLLARTKTIEELTAEPLFAGDCALLDETEEVIGNIVNQYSDAAKNLGLPSA